jgi:hypothetical protein
MMNGLRALSIFGRTAVARRDGRLRLAFACALLGVLTVAGSAAAAASPEKVELISSMDIGGAFNTGNFSRAAGSDLICAAGTVTDTRYVWGISQGPGGNPNGVPLEVDKTFDCGDGQLFFRLHIRGVFATETFSWVVLGGTGRYVGIHGQGEGWTDVADFDTCTCVVNHYSGYLIP